MNTISINGMNISASGNVSVLNGRVMVNGVDVTPADVKEISVIINGDTDKIEVDSCNYVSITGKVGSVKTMSGDVDIEGDVAGSVSTMSGDIECHSIGGSVSTMSGNIKHKK